MSDLNSLMTFNEGIYKLLSLQYKHFQIGFFNGNTALFIGQNPGMPFTDKQIQEIEDLLQYTNYIDREKAYTEMWKKSLFGEFIAKLISNHWDRISFTNYVKIPTISNSIPLESDIYIFKPIIERQIELLWPKIIVCFGKFVGSQFGLTRFYETNSYKGIQTTMLLHPAFLARKGTEFESNEIKKMREHLEELLEKSMVYTPMPDRRPYVPFRGL